MSFNVMIISRPARSLVLTHALAALVLSGGLAAGIATASPGLVETWTVKGDLRGEQKRKKTDGFKESRDVSGLACDGGGYPRLCIIADDEMQGAQVVILKDGELIAGDYIPLISETFDKEPLELDAEAVAFWDGSFYVMGSHGRPWHKDNEPTDMNNAKAEATRRIFRITFLPGAVDMGAGGLNSDPSTRRITSSSALFGIIKAQPKLSEFADKPLEENGLTIEGVAARDGRLYVGLRGPVLADAKAVVLEVPLGAVFDGQQGEASLHELDLGKDTQGNPRGIRDLVPQLNGFLVLAGPVKDPKHDDKHVIRKGDYTVFSWNPNTGKPDGYFDIEGFGPKIKPEVILPLEAEANNLKALILFDGPENGMPMPMSIKLRPCSFPEGHPRCR